MDLLEGLRAAKALSRAAAHRDAGRDAGSTSQLLADIDDDNSMVATQPHVRSTTVPKSALPIYVKSKLAIAVDDYEVPRAAQLKSRAAARAEPAVFEETASQAATTMDDAEGLRAAKQLSRAAALRERQAQAVIRAGTQHEPQAEVPQRQQQPTRLRYTVKGMLTKEETIRDPRYLRYASVGWFPRSIIPAVLVPDTAGSLQQAMVASVHQVLIQERNPLVTNIPVVDKAELIGRLGKNLEQQGCGPYLLSRSTEAANRYQGETADALFDYWKVSAETLRTIDVVVLDEPRLYSHGAFISIEQHFRSEPLTQRRQGGDIAFGGRRIIVLESEPPIAAQPFRQCPECAAWTKPIWNEGFKRLAMCAVTMAAIEMNGRKS